MRWMPYGYTWLCCAAFPNVLDRHLPTHVLTLTGHPISRFLSNVEMTAPVLEQVIFVRSKIIKNRLGTLFQMLGFSV